MSADLEPFRQSVVRIQSLDAITVGLGWRIDKNITATSAHVVSTLLGGDEYSKTPPSGILRVRLAVGSIDLGAASVHRRGWFPKSERRGADDPSDIALLYLENPPPLLHRPVEISSVLTSSGIQCKLLGTQRSADEALVPMDAVVGDISEGRFLLRQVGLGYRIGPGCSGAPVVDEATGTIVGMVVQREFTPGLDIAYMIPAAQLRECLHRAGLVVRPSSSWPFEAIRSWVHREIAQQDPTLGRQLTDFIHFHAVSNGTLPPFAERQRETRRLENLLLGGRSVYLTRRTGCGNSASLLRLASYLLEECPDWRLLFLPISARFETADENAGLRLLYLQMTSLFAELRVGRGEQLTVKDYRDCVLRGWEFIRNRIGRRFVLIIDGANEAVGHWLDDKVLPVEVPKNLAVLVSAHGEAGSLRRADL